MSITVGPTGQLITGDVLDVNKAPLEEMVRHYDSRLYLKWNPKKNRGYGCWELRIRPDRKTIVSSVMYKGNTYCMVDYKENDLEHHVFDLVCLNYSLLDRIKQADMWAACNYEKQLHHRLNGFLREQDGLSSKYKQDVKDKLRNEMLYNLKQDKQIIQDFQEKVVAGVNPAHLMRFWK